MFTCSWEDLRTVSRSFLTLTLLESKVGTVTVGSIGSNADFSERGALLAGCWEKSWTVGNFWASSLLVAKALTGFDLAIILDAFWTQSLALLASSWNALLADCGTFALLVAEPLAGFYLTIILDAFIT